MPRDIHKLRAIHKRAIAYDWKFLEWQESIGMVSYVRYANIAQARQRVNIYHTTMTVATCLNHPKSGRTQLFRKNVNMKLLEHIFYNPRIHTNKGYRLKKHGKDNYKKV